MNSRVATGGPGLLIAGLILSILCQTATAQSLTSHAPRKAPAVAPFGLADTAIPDALRQGGEDFDTATHILALPYADTGTTCGYADDIEIPWPYEADGPDVVYSLVLPGFGGWLTADLCGSDYDTKLGFFDTSEELFAANDDYYGGPPCGLYVSKLDHFFAAGGDTIYIVVDGYGGDCGNYILEVTYEAHEPCEITAPAAAILEGEPELQDGYVDAFNGGCNFDLYEPAFQALGAQPGGVLDLLGHGGWYATDGEDFRDTDWFLLRLDPDGDGTMTVTLQAQESSALIEAGPHDCVEVTGVQAEYSVECEIVSMTITGEPGDLIWLVVLADSYHPPAWQAGYEFEYWLHVEGLAESVVRTQAASWSAVKGLFR